VKHDFKIYVKSKLKYQNHMRFEVFILKDMRFEVWRMNFWKKKEGISYLILGWLWWSDWRVLMMINEDDNDGGVVIT